jgi:hypothetical protein
VFRSRNRGEGAGVFWDGTKSEGGFERMSEVKIKLIYSEDYLQFTRTRKELGIRRNDVHFVAYGDMEDLMRLSKGLYAEQIYPRWANDLLESPRPLKNPA